MLIFANIVTTTEDLWNENKFHIIWLAVNIFESEKRIEFHKIFLQQTKVSLIHSI